MIHRPPRDGKMAFVQSPDGVSINQLYPKLLWELAEEFRNYAQGGGQVFVSTHSPDFLNAVRLDEIFWLMKNNGYSVIKRACENTQLAALAQEGEQMGYLWNEGLFSGVAPQ